MLFRALLFSSQLKYSDLLMIGKTNDDPWDTGRGTCMSVDLCPVVHMIVVSALGPYLGSLVCTTLIQAKVLGRTRLGSRPSIKLRTDKKLHVKQLQGSLIFQLLK
jgi:hypothetical protein